MKSRNIFLFTFSLAYALNLSDSLSFKLKVVNNTNKEKYLFFQPKTQVSTNNTRPYRIVVAATPRNQEQIIEIPEDQAKIMDYYHVVAADYNGDPDWKLLGGECENLHKDLDAKIIIDSAGMGLKTTCKAYRVGTTN